MNPPRRFLRHVLRYDLRYGMALLIVSLTLAAGAARAHGSVPFEALLDAPPAPLGMSEAWLAQLASTLTALAAALIGAAKLIDVLGKTVNGWIRAWRGLPDAPAPAPAPTPAPQ